MNAPIKLLKFFSFALLLAGAAPAAHAQVSVNVQVGAPVWGPPVPAGVQYYYIPEIDGYYDLYNGVYLVFRDGYWMTLPSVYGYDPYAFHPVPVYYQGPQPWQYVVQHRARYGPPLVGASPNWNRGHAYGYGGRDAGQRSIYNSPVPNGPGRQPNPGGNGSGRVQPGGPANPGGGRATPGPQGSGRNGGNGNGGERRGR